MAIACTEPVADVASSTDGTSFAMSAFTPTADAILTVLVFATDTTAAGTMSGGSLTWTRKTSVAYNGGLDTAYLFWAKTGSSPGSTTITFDCTGDSATGATMVAFQWTGADVVTSDPIKQAITNTGLSQNETVTFGTALGTNNGYGFGFGIAGINPPAGTPPASWTEIADTGYATPTCGACAAFRATGETGTTYTYTIGVTDLLWGAIGFEVYTSGAGPAPNTPAVTQIVRAFGYDQPAHPGSAQYRSAMPPPTAFQLSGRLVMARGYDQPPHEGSASIRIGKPDVNAAQLPGRPLMVRGEDARPEDGRRSVATSPPPPPPFGPPPKLAHALGDEHPMEPGRVIRGVQALVANPASQKPARTVTVSQTEDRAPDPGRAWHQASPPGVSPGQKAGKATVARGDDAPMEPGRVSIVLRVEFEAPQPGRVTRARGEDAQPEPGRATFARLSLGIPAARATRLVVNGAEGAPFEPGRVQRSARPPADPPPVVPPRPVVAFGWGPQPDAGSARILRPVGLTNQLPPRPTLANGEGPPVSEGRAFIGRVPTSPLTPQQRPGRVLVARGDDPMPEGGRFWRARPILLPDAGQAGHVARMRPAHAADEQPVRVLRNLSARVARWPS